MPAHAPEQRLMSVVAYLLKQEDPVPWHRLREEFQTFYAGNAEATERKWTRDRQTLKAAGIPIEYIRGELGSEGGYVIRPEAYELRDLQLTPDEAAVLWTAANAASRMREHPWRHHVAAACSKLRAACRGLPPASPALPLRHAEGPHRAHLGQIVERIGEAVRRRKRVSLEYYTVSRGELTHRLVDIYGFAWRRGEWLFAGYCHSRRELRVFYVTQVRALTVNDRQPGEADYEIPASFDIATFSRQQPWEFWAHEPLEAEVRLRGSLAPLAASLLPGGRIAGAENEARVYLPSVRDLHALVRTVLALGPDAELCSPEEGRALARQMLTTLDAQLGAPAEVRG